ncbi:MAG: hypothetical protein KGJ13_10825, partial [Patescibacteria group bacterium]|nr:hypothetical protein [Patescibacteria group bacterium]
MITPLIIGAGILLLLEAARLFIQPSAFSIQHFSLSPGNSYAASGRREPQCPAREPNTSKHCDS